MIRYLLNSISNATGFSKTEAKGTLLLSLMLLAAILIANHRIALWNGIQPQEEEKIDTEWIEMLYASVKPKKTEEQHNNLNKKNGTADAHKKAIPPLLYEKGIPTPVEKKAILKKDLNSVTAMELQQVKGIGQVFSGRIVKYRTMLGGFNQPSQLSEVYGLEQKAIDALLDMFSIQSKVHPIPINTDSIKLLIRHPYIKYDLARVIINYRKEHGDIGSIDELKKIKALDERTLMLIQPYLEQIHAENTEVISEASQ